MFGGAAGKATIANAQACPKGGLIGQVIEVSPTPRGEYGNAWAHENQSIDISEYGTGVGVYAGTGRCARIIRYGGMAVACKALAWHWHKPLSCPRQQNRAKPDDHHKLCIWSFHHPSLDSNEHYSREMAGSHLCLYSQACPCSAPLQAHNSHI